MAEAVISGVSQIPVLRRADCSAKAESSEGSARQAIEGLCAKGEAALQAGRQVERLLSEQVGSGRGAAALAAAAAGLGQAEVQRRAAINEMAGVIARSSPAPAGGFSHDGGSSWKLAADVVEGIKGASEGYLRQRADIAKTYTEFYKDISSLIGVIGKSVGNSGRNDKDGEWLYFDQVAVENKMKEFKGKWQGWHICSTGGTELLDEYGEGFFRRGSGKIYIDTSVLDKMIDELGKMAIDRYENRIWVKLPSYNAWRAGFDGHEHQIQTKMRQAAERYSHANSKFDNLVNVLMKMISSLYDTDKQYLT